MITKHSIDLTMVREPCFAWSPVVGCKILTDEIDGCGTYRCPFYKPVNCRDWIRIEDGRGISMVPPEDLKEER